MEKWISVKDGLPINSADEMGESQFIAIEVLVTDGINVWTEQFKAGNTVHFWKQFDVNPETITHWQPFPSPPKEQP